MSNRLPKDKYIFVSVEDMPSNVHMGVNKEWSDRNPEHSVSVTANTICAPLRGLIRQYATSYPNWTFECLHTYYRPSAIDEVKVFVGDEYIGMIGYNSRRSKFQVSSPKIERDMDRKRMRETANLAIAHKLICSFSTKSLGEHLAEDKSDIRDGLRRMSRTTHSNLRSLSENLAPIFQEYVLANWEDVLEWVSKNGKATNRMHELHDTIYQNTSTQDMFAGKGLCVSVRDDAYVVEKDEKDAGSERFTVYSNSDRLPSELRQAIGLLKLVCDNSILNGVGYRHEYNKYFVLSEYLETNKG
jgi:hypothetical protein